MAVDKRALRTRAIVTPLLLGFIVAVYFVDRDHTGGVVSAIVLGLLSIAAAWEYATMLGNAGVPVGRGFLIVAAACLHVLAFVSPDELGWGSLSRELLAPVLVTVGLTFALSLRSLARARMHEGLEGAGTTLLGLVLCCWPMYLGQSLALHGIDALFFAVLVAKSGDIGGYLGGVTLGRHKLCPHISPGKTVEGALGSLVLAVVVAVSLRHALLPPGLVSVLGAVALGILLNVTTQCGDLMESAVKRRCDVKDSSHMLPVHGGVLDLIDSLLFSLPAFFFVFVRLT